MSLRTALRAEPSTEVINQLESLRRQDAQVLLIHHRLREPETQSLLKRAGSPAIWPDHEPADGPGEVLLTTSGTSGQPRLVRLPWAALTAGAESLWDRVGGEPGDHWLCPLPLAHVAGLAIFERCRAGGGTMRLLAEGGDGQALLAALSKPEVSFVSLVPTQLSRLLEALGDRPAPGQVKAVLLGGAAIAPDLLRRARSKGLPIICSYGMTEAGSTVATTSPRDALDPQAPGDRAELLAGLEATVVGGELQLRGGQLFSGYVGESPRAPGAWFATGDLAELSDDRWIRILGRLGASIKRGGEWVDPEEVEALLADHPQVAEAAILPIPDDDLGHRLMAFIVPSPEAQADVLETVETYARTRLASFKAPDLWRLHREPLPRSPLGKLRRDQLKP